MTARTRSCPLPTSTAAFRAACRSRAAIGDDRAIPSASAARSTVFPKPHRNFLAAGGLGLLIGDGQLNYGTERILETYYAYAINKTLTVTADYQLDRKSRLQRRPRTGLDFLRPPARRILNKAAPMAHQDLRPAALGHALRPNIWDAVALIFVIGAMVLIVYGGEQTTAPLSTLEVTPVSLDPANLPGYALRTTLRMLLAIVCSIIFTFIYAALAAKSRRAEMVLIPLLDILQSVPILGFLTFTVVFFMNLFPGSVLGAELACVFAIFTSQAWNMTFSMYQSMRNVPKDLEEASQSFHLIGLAALLAARRALRDAGPDLEHDDVDVRRLVLRGGVGGDHRRQHHGHAARHRILRRAGHRKAESRRDRLRAAGHAARHRRLRSIAVSSYGGLGRQIPLRADGVRKRADILDARPVPPHAGATGADLSFAALNSAFSNLHIRWPASAPAMTGPALARSSTRSGLASSSRAPSMRAGRPISISRPV